VNAGLEVLREAGIAVLYRVHPFAMESGKVIMGREKKMSSPGRRVGVHVHAEFRCQFREGL
jgi:hypothetical protein